MAEMSYTFYDTVTFDDAAKVVHEAFQNRQGSDSTNDQFKTNSRGNGEFPQNESFLVKKLGFYPDSVLALADVEASMLNSYFQINYQDKIVFQASLRECVMLSAWGGHFAETTASDVQNIGLMGNGYDLGMPLKIDGGNSFRVLIGQGTALSVATRTFKVLLIGTYSQGKGQ